MAGSEFSAKSINAWTKPALCQYFQASGAMETFLTHFGPVNANQSLLEFHSLYI